MAEKNSIPYPEKGDKEQLEKFLQPFMYILQVPGKQIRVKMLHAMNYWLKIPIEKLQAIGDITHMVHNASFITDDIQDNSILRGGIPVAHGIYGIPLTISAANYVLFAALERVLALNHPMKFLQPFMYILQVPGKQIRVKMLHAMNYWLKIPIEKLQAIGDITHMVHNASFITDDIQDNSILRGGIPVAHGIYGIPLTISAANYVLFAALERVLALNHPMAPQIYMEHLLDYHQGQGMDIYWRDNYVCPTEEEYRFMTIKKTGSICNLTFRLIQLFSECKEDFSDLMDILGLYYQIRGDYGNLCPKEDSENKGYCQDISEGQFSFPIIHAIRSHPEDNQVMNILRQRTTDVNVKKYCVTLLEKFGSFAYTRSVLKKLDQSLRDEIERLGGNPLLTAVLDELLDWTENEKGEITASQGNRVAACENSNVHV